jgi:general secretion pathway protein D
MSFRNRQKHTISIFVMVLLCVQIGAVGQSIEEKRASLESKIKSSSPEGILEGSLERLNQDIKKWRQLLKAKYSSVAELTHTSVDDQAYVTLLHEVNELKTQLYRLEVQWRERNLEEIGREDESYAFWDQEETTLSQLVMEYGSSDYLYVVPPEMLTMKVHVHSMMPIPRESWSDLLEIILSQNGIGFKQLNPYARQLYMLKQDLLTVDHITNNPHDLKKIPANTRIIYVFSPPPEQVKSVGFFFERFRDPKRTFIYQAGFKVAIVSTKEEVEKLLSLYDAVWEKESEKVTKVVPLKKMSPSDVEKILRSYFGDLADKNRMSVMKGSEDLSIMTLSHEASLVLIGMKDMVNKAEEIIKDTEGQINNPCEMTVHWYTYP